MGLLELVLVAMCVAGAIVIISDIMFRRISNRVCLTVFCLSVLAATLQQADIAPHVLSFSVVAIIALVLFFTNVIGGGDAKLMVAFSLSLPLSLIDDALFLMAISGGVLAVFYLVKYRLLKLVPSEGTIGLPYGIAISAGFCTVILSYYL
jgi:prepilin peptidase CpaA